MLERRNPLEFMGRSDLDRTVDLLAARQPEFEF